MKSKVIFKNSYEIQCGSDRQSWAEGLISQLPKDHEGRNSWLLNFGKGKEAKRLRRSRGIKWIKYHQSAEVISC